MPIIPSIQEIRSQITPEIQQSAQEFAAMTANPVVSVKVKIDDIAFKKLKGIARGLGMQGNLNACASNLLQSRGKLEIRDGNVALKKVAKIKQIKPSHEVELLLPQSTVDLWDITDLNDFLGGIIHLFIPQRF